MLWKHTFLYLLVGIVNLLKIIVYGVEKRKSSLRKSKTEKKTSEEGSLHSRF